MEPSGRTTFAVATARLDPAADDDGERETQEPISSL
jgi:hypothetical protein